MRTTWGPDARTLVPTVKNIEGHSSALLGDSETVFDCVAVFSYKCYSVEQGPPRVDCWPC